jgi:hypothetical protein
MNAGARKACAADKNVSTAIYDAREQMGPEGEAVVYFRDAEEAAQRARVLLCDCSESKRLAAGLHRRIVGLCASACNDAWHCRAAGRARECQMNFAV